MHAAEASEIRQFVTALFPYADDDSYISLRAFHQSRRDVAPIHIEAFRIGDGVEKLVTAANRVVLRAANGAEPAVFAPPVATFKTSASASTANIANGVALSVELDEGDPAVARQKLEHLLGPVTIALHSGSVWADPETGELFSKTHFHWRLSEPTRETADHEMLREARWLAAALVGADFTASSVVHPLRWPGSWNLKTAPRLAKICAGNQASEIHLADALTKLQEAVEAAGIKRLGNAAERIAGDPTARYSQVSDALQAIPNQDLSWEEWNRLGMATWRATSGSTEGLLAWSDWSAKSPKHHDDDCAARWANYAISPPSKLGAGTIFYLAAQNGWEREQISDSAPPDDPDDPGFIPSEEDVAHLAAALPKGTKALWITDEEWDEAGIPQRPWVAKGYLMRGSVSVAAGAGSAGKSSIGVAWAIALALGKTWSRFKPSKPYICSIYNVEDDDNEQKRRISATLRQFRCSPTDLRGVLHRLGPTNVGTLIERDTQTGKLRFTDAMRELIDHLESVRPQVLILDPLVELHNSDENDNTSLRGVMATLRALAVRFDCAIMLIHHARKGSGGAPGDPDSIRGAGAIVGAARVALTVCTMTEQEADELNVDKLSRFDYFRVDGAKSNYAKVEQAEWFKREVYELANGEEVVAAEPWKAPSVWKEMQKPDLDAALDRIAAGPSPGVLYAPSNRGASNTRWVGNPIMQILRLNETQAFGVVKAWLRSGLLVETTYRDSSTRKDRPGVTVDRTKQP